MNMRYCLRSLLAVFVCLSVLFSNIHIVSAADSIINTFPSESGSFDVSTAIYLNNSYRNRITLDDYKKGDTLVLSQDGLLNYHYPPSLQYAYVISLTSNNMVFGRQGSELDVVLKGIFNYLVNDRDERFILDIDWATDNYVIVLKDYYGNSVSFSAHDNVYVQPFVYDLDSGSFSLSFTLKDLPIDVSKIEIYCYSDMSWFYSTRSGDFWEDEIANFQYFDWYSGVGTSGISVTNYDKDKTEELLEENRDILGEIWDDVDGLWETLLAIGQTIGAIPQLVAQAIEIFFDDVVSGISKLGSDIKGFFNSLTSSIGGFFTNLTNSLKGFFDGLLTGILEGLKSLFVPSEEAVDDFFSYFQNSMKDSFGALYEVFDLLFMYAESFRANEQGYIEFPTLSLPLGQVNFEFGGWRVKVVPDGFSVLIESLKTLVSISSTVLFVNGLRSRFDKVVSK